MEGAGDAQALGVVHDLLEGDLDLRQPECGLPPADLVSVASRIRRGWRQDSISRTSSPTAGNGRCHNQATCSQKSGSTAEWYTPSESGEMGW